MANDTAPQPQRAAWWARLATGEIRRIWVVKTGDFYHCAVEILTPEQEAARLRLAQLEFAATSHESPDAAQRAADTQALASIRGLVRRTANPREAFLFLGADDAALGALIEADPGLSSIPGDAWASRPVERIPE